MRALQRSALGRPVKQAPGSAGILPAPRATRVATALVLGGVIVMVAGLTWGCAAPGVATRPSTATLEIVPAIASGGTFRAQTLIAPYTSGDIGHLVIQIYTVAGTAEIPVEAVGGGPIAKDVAGGALGQPVKFFNLHQDTTYRLRGFAYKAAGTAAADKISLDASSSVDVAVGRDDRPQVAALPVWLVDRTFSGKATSSVEFKPGPVDNAGAEDFDAVPL